MDNLFKNFKDNLISSSNEKRKWKRKGPLGQESC